MPSINKSIHHLGGSSLSRMFQPSFSPATRYSLGHWEAFPGQMKHIILSAGSGVPSQLGVSEKPQSEVPRRHHSSGFTLGSLRISKFLTLSLWLSPAELWRWLILVVCICNLTLLNRHPDLMTIDGLKCTLTGKTKASPSSPVLVSCPVQYLHINPPAEPVSPLEYDPKSCLCKVLSHPGHVSLNSLKKGWFKCLV